MHQPSFIFFDEIVSKAKFTNFYFIFNRLLIDVFVCYLNKDAFALESTRMVLFYLFSNLSPYIRNESFVTLF